MYKTVYHIAKPDTPVEMYEVDARGAVANFPEEYSEQAWSEDHAKAWAERNAPKSEKQPDSADFVAPFEARDKGRGWWAIYDVNGKQVGGGIREADGKAFNAMSEEDKQEYVNAELAQG